MQNSTAKQNKVRSRYLSWSQLCSWSLDCYQDHQCDSSWHSCPPPWSHSWNAVGCSFKHAVDLLGQPVDSVAAQLGPGCGLEGQALRQSSTSSASMWMICIRFFHSPVSSVSFVKLLLFDIGKLLNQDKPYFFIWIKNEMSKVLNNHTKKTLHEAIIFNYFDFSLNIF